MGSRSQSHVTHSEEALNYEIVWYSTTSFQSIATTQGSLTNMLLLERFPFTKGLHECRSQQFPTVRDMRYILSRPWVRCSRLPSSTRAIVARLRGFCATWSRNDLQGNLIQSCCNPHPGITAYEQICGDVSR